MRNDKRHCENVDSLNNKDVVIAFNKKGIFYIHGKTGNNVLLKNELT